MAKRRLSWLMIIPPVVFAVFVGLALSGLYRDDPSALPSTRIGKLAPAVTEVPLPGYAPVLPGDLARGEVTLVNFWASWCPPCRVEHPKLLELQAEGVPIIGVNFRDKEVPARRYLEEAENPFVAVAFDPDGRTAIEWGVTAPPETFILSGDGTVLYRYAGPLVGSDFENRFLPEFEKAKAAEGGSTGVLSN